MMAKRGDPLAKAWAGSLSAAYDEEITIVGDFNHPSFGKGSFVRRGDGKPLYLAAIQNLFVGLPRFRFNRHRDRIYLDIDWSADLKIDDFVVIEAYASMNPETYTDAYSDIFLKKYCTALMKKQWGMNLIKFEGVQLPGGVTLNGRQLYDDAVTELEKLEVEGRLEYQLPDDFYMG